jgi:hypothetical protein
MPPSSSSRTHHKSPPKKNSARRCNFAIGSIVIEYLDLHHPGPTRLVSVDAAAALDVRRRADWAHPIGDAFSNVRAYRDRLNDDCGYP